MCSRQTWQLAAQAVRGFRQIASQKQQLGVLPKQQTSTLPVQDIDGEQPAATPGNCVGQPRSSGGAAPMQPPDVIPPVQRADTGAVHQLETAPSSCAHAPSALCSTPADSALLHSHDRQHQLAGLQPRAAEQSHLQQLAHPPQADSTKHAMQLVGTSGAEHANGKQPTRPDTGSVLAVTTSHSKSLPQIQSSRKRSVPEPDARVTDSAAAIHTAASGPHNPDDTAQEQLQSCVSADGPAVCSQVTKRARPAGAGAARQTPVSTKPNSKACKAPARAKACRTRRAGKACSAAAGQAGMQSTSNAPDGSSQQAHQERVTRRPLRTCQTNSTAVINSFSEHDSSSDDYADGSSHADSDTTPDLDALHDVSVCKTAVRAVRSTRQELSVRANAGHEPSQQYASSTNQEAEFAETVVCDSDADDTGSGEVLGASPERAVTKSSKRTRLPSKTAVRAGAQQAKQASARSDKGGQSSAAGARRGGHRRTATRQNFVRCNLKASCTAHACLHARTGHAPDITILSELLL